MCTRGNASDMERARFAREAETLQNKALLIGRAIGMGSVMHATATSDSGETVAFKFAKSSSDGFDARGLLGTDLYHTSSSIIDVIS